MDFLIVSDSHGSSYEIVRAWDRQVKRPDYLIHCGDGASDLSGWENEENLRIVRVRGNCDFFLGKESDVPRETILECEGHRILITHGHLHSVKSGYSRLIADAVSEGCDIALFGHTHDPYGECISEGEEVGGVILPRPFYLFNPGSIGGDGSFGTLHLTGDTVLFSHGRV